jgi:RNase P/RNase MRP subunit POP5
VEWEGLDFCGFLLRREPMDTVEPIVEVTRPTSREAVAAAMALAEGRMRDGTFAGFSLSALGEPGAITCQLWIAYKEEEKE